MAGNEKRVLVSIVRLYKRQLNPAPVSMLRLVGLRQLRLKRTELDGALRRLEQEGLLAVLQPDPERLLLQPTMLGLERGTEWEKELEGRSLRGRLRSGRKLVVGALLAAALGLAAWWLGVSPETSGLVPLRARVPIRMYAMGSTPGDEFPPINVWYHIPDAPADGELLLAKDAEQSQQVLSELMPEQVPAVLDGRVTVRFDLENIAPANQVDIDKVQVEVKREPAAQVEDLYYAAPALGGGGFQSYELKLSRESLGAQEQGTQVYEAHLSSAEGYDFIFLQPGERQSFEVTIELDEPGSYVLTPVVVYSFRDRQAKVSGEESKFVYPGKFRGWLWQWEPSGQGGALISNHTIWDTRTDAIEFEDVAARHKDAACLAEKKWVAFESSFISFGYAGRLYVIDTNGENLRMIWNRAANGRRLEWLESGLLEFDDPTWDDSAHGYQPRWMLAEPSTWNVSEQAPEASLAAEAPREGCFADGSGCITSKAVEDTNRDGNLDYEDLQQLYLEKDGRETRLGYSEGDQFSPTISPDGAWIAYVQSDCSGACASSMRQQVYMMKADGSEVHQVTSAEGMYREPMWSPNMRYLVYQSARAGEPGGGIYALYALDLENGTEMRLMEGRALGAVLWSADGEWLLVGGDALSLARVEGGCTQTLFVPPVGHVGNMSMQR